MRGIREADAERRRRRSLASPLSMPACARCGPMAGSTSYAGDVDVLASYNLWLPWRDSGLHLARQFVDYEPGIHWSQCQMQSGSTSINTIRIYNPIKQGMDHDPEGVFIRRVPSCAMFRPFTSMSHGSLAVGCQHRLSMSPHPCARRRTGSGRFDARPGLIAMPMPFSASMDPGKPV